MPESRIRRKRASTPPSDASAKTPAGRAETGGSAVSVSDGSRAGKDSPAGKDSLTGKDRASGKDRPGSKDSPTKGTPAGKDAMRPRKPVRTGPKPTPRWWVPVMLGLMILGLLWIVTFYLSGFRQYPVPAIGAWNLAAGFALIIAGFAMTTRWR